MFTKTEAQILTNRDTVYYLVDTAKTPPMDRLIKVGTEGPWYFFSIECTCLKYNQRPTFIYDLKNPGSEPVNNSILKKIKFISLSKLLELSRDDAGEAFNNKHLAYFIEKKGNKYVKTKVRLLKPLRHETINDYENIQPVDSNKRKKP